MAQKEEESPNLGRLDWLIKRMLAKKCPITDEQVERFGLHPAGPILPENCLGVRRLPAEFGPVYFRGKHRTVLAMTLTPDKQLCFAAVRNGKVVLTAGNQQYELLPFEKPEEHGGAETVEDVVVLGFDAAGVPWTLISKYYSGPVDPIPVPSQSVYHGEVELRKAVSAAALLSDGRLIYTRWVSGETNYIIFQNDHPLHVTGRNYHCFWELDNGELVGQWLARDPDTKEQKWLIGPVMWGEDHNFGEHFVDVVATKDGSAFVYQRRKGDRCGTVTLCRLDKATRKLNFDRALGDNEYRGHYTELPDGRPAYIGLTHRDGFECWVVAGEEQPGFERVSPLLERDGRQCYWAALGRHLYLMEIPVADKT